MQNINQKNTYKNADNNTKDYPKFDYKSCHISFICHYELFFLCCLFILKKYKRKPLSPLYSHFHKSIWFYMKQTQFFIHEMRVETK